MLDASERNFQTFFAHCSRKIGVLAREIKYDIMLYRVELYKLQWNCTENQGQRKQNHNWISFDVKHTICSVFHNYLLWFDLLLAFDESQKSPAELYTVF